MFEVNNIEIKVGEAVHAAQGDRQYPHFLRWLSMR
jgi:hypothetical protein